ncbi:MAG: MarP family serine protease [Nocardioidaceae bacterium]
MNGLDWLLLLGILVYAISGYQQGFLVGAASTSGLLIGGLLGIQVTPLLFDGFDPGMAVSLAAVLFVLACAFLGQALGAYAGGRLRTRVTWHPARVVDALSGSVLSVVAMLLIAWVLGVAVNGVDMRGLNRAVRTSAVLGTVDDMLPGDADRLMSAFNSLVGSSQFPTYLEPFTAERIKPVEPPATGVAARPGVRVAQESVVKVLGEADSCGRNLEGTGFVYEAGLVMTNAHVVAGVDEPLVEVGDADHEATVVYYDSDVDVAVLSVPDLVAPELSFAGPAESGDMAAVLGYPENGPYDVQPARVRDRQTLSSTDIYGNDSVERDTYSIFSLVRPGNSGGPLVSPNGRVLGVIFAASVTDARTGYALTADQVAAAADAGRTSTGEVDTGGCAL